MTILTQDNHAVMAPPNPLGCPSYHLPVHRQSFEPHSAPLSQSDPFLLLAEHLPLLRRVCDRFKDFGEPVEDLVLVGFGGLLEAVEEFEPSSIGDFVVFAMPLIVGAILDCFKDRGWAVRNPDQLVTQKTMVDQVLVNFNQMRNRAPTIPEIVDATGLSAEMVLQTMENRLH